MKQTNYNEPTSLHMSTYQEEGVHLRLRGLTHLHIFPKQLELHPISVFPLPIGLLECNGVAVKVGEIFAFVNKGVCGARKLGLGFF